jgi:hypothetical protein
MSSMSAHDTAAPQAATFTANDKASSAAPIIVLHEDIAESVSPSIPPLFKPTKVRVKEYWEIISLVAPFVDESKEWKTSDAVKAYCTKCNIPIHFSKSKAGAETYDKGPWKLSCEEEKTHRS